MSKTDIAFIGHMCRDEIFDARGQTSIAIGSAVLCGAMAAVKCGKKVAAIIKMDPKDAPCMVYPP